MNIKKIIREEIQKLEEKVISLSKDEMSILHRNKEIEKDGHIIRYNDEIEEGFGGEFLSKKERKIFEKERLENAEVLGYKLTGTKDINEATVTFRGARGRSVVVPNEYVGKLGRVEHKLMDMLGYINGKHNIIADWSWGYNSRQKMKPNDEFSSSIILRSHPYIKGGRRELQKGDVKVIIATLNKLLRANRLKIEKPKYRPDVNYPMIEFRVKPNQFKESVNEGRFYAFYNNKKYKIGGKDLYNAKLQAIEKLKIPKSKQGLLAIMSVKAYNNQQFRFETVNERDYKEEYKKYGSSTKAKKYRAELNQYNRKNGTYGNGDGKDASHKGGKIVGFEKESTNRGRAEKSRLKKESVNESTKEYEKTLIKILKDKQINQINKMLSLKDKKTLLKIAKMMRKANESVFAVNLDKEKNDERYPEQPNINYDPEKGKSRIRKIR